MAPLDLSNKKIVLLLQGGGALGAYQVGAFKALAEKCHEANSRIHWVAGISIGSINAAVIASPKCGDPVKELESLWAEIRTPAFPPFDYTAIVEMFQPWLARSRRTLESKYADWTWMAFNPLGQLNFFTSRVLNPFLNPWINEWFRRLDRDELGFYGTEPMRQRLEAHVNWEALIGDRVPRLSVGATRISDGEVVFFDSMVLRTLEKDRWIVIPREEHLTSAHVMASCALPPAFPPIEVEGEWYFDGGVSNNTPIEALRDQLLLEEEDKRDIVVFAVDLWDRKDDEMPRTLDDVVWRMKSIQFGSRRKAAETVVRHHEYLEEHKKADGPHIHLDVCQVLLENKKHGAQFSFSDADFSQRTYDVLSTRGYDDMLRAIDHPDLVEKVGGKFAALYRFGAQHKHRPTDRLLAA
ncbi:MAG TPA: patatin-like phospholipase family protein [Terracidiphilus sp.]|nr:patatin-like phospholipase family protein [Terracidiphilus sp.]